MSKFVRAAQTSQSLSLVAMEEASRLGLRTADIEHLFLALVVSDQSAGRALRDIGIDLDVARRAVEEQHQAQLASLGIGTSFPEAGRIVFHETDGYEWSKRASDLIARSVSRHKAGDAAAVLQELVSEPSGLIAEILERLDTTPDAVLDHLSRFGSPEEVKAPTAAEVEGWASGSMDAFVPAPREQVWQFLSDPIRVPDCEMSVGTVELLSRDAPAGTVWQGLAPMSHPNGKPVKHKARFRRRNIELVAARRPERIVWSFTYPDAPRSASVRNELFLVETTGGTRVRITKSWSRREGWRRLVALPLRPAQKFLLWINLLSTSGAISRAFR
ncbi:MULTISPECIES: Clp protease N-terminal domain-containing protein [unclassified Microbacterium]|uniref:Clp protease N-terminal domain-containing protein n=1 Tax=unclassified Microbacterium TaxID=2609290 RepID=UPI000EAA0085|nr:MULTISPECIES: Clp protease N-terminal domain-containing protein [unclassified Microbacterium]MBT2486200.1 SRPBCC domain-containing protein [Microbacterium sp. ISL-108]RKN68922.1 Clp protease [Microbacterium sp. CGR2]